MKYKNTQKTYDHTPLYRRTREEIKSDTELELLIDEGWRHFWKKRGHKTPPYVSDRRLGVFDTI